MNKKFITISYLFILFIFILVCSCGTQNHEHTFSKEWSHDNFTHFHEATCEHTEEKADTAPHSYGEWVIVEPATEYKKGSRKRSCRVCEYSQVEDLDILHKHTFSDVFSCDETHHWFAAICEHKEEKKGYEPHTYGAWEILKEPTETDKGQRRRICTQCKYEDIEILSIHQHEYDSKWTSDASGHWHQAICEHKEERTELEEHTYGEWIIIKYPSAQEEGSRKKICSTCKYEITETIDDITHEHIYGKWQIVQAPTLSSEGEIVRVCSLNSTHIEKVNLPILDQVNYTYSKVEPTCFEDGQENYIYKWIGGISFNIVLPTNGHSFSSDWKNDEEMHWHIATCEHKGETTTPEPHSFGDWIIVTPATDEQEGRKVKKCLVCQYEIFEIIEQLPHTHRYSADWSHNEIYHWHAAVCSHKEERLDFGEHSFGPWQIIKEPTPTDAGSKKRSCLTCGYEEIVYDGHIHSYPDTYSKNDTMHWKECSCGNKIEEELHTYGDWEYLKDPTSEEKGLKKRTCTVCDYEQYETIDYVEHVHIFETKWSYDEDNHWQSATCHPEEKRNITTHSFGTWQITTNATEFQKGERKRKCVVCDYVEIEELPQLPHIHSYGDWQIILQPTKTTQGQMQRICQVDGHISTFLLPELNQNDYSFEYIPSTCQVEGKEIYTLSKDNQKLEFTLSVEKIDHIYQQEYDAIKHWNRCVMCNNIIQEEEHNLGNNECHVCHYQFYSPGLEFTLNDDAYSYSVSLNSASVEDIIIPSHYNGNLVTTLKAINNSIIKTISLPQTITIIEENAFLHCPNLEFNLLENGCYLGNAENPYTWFIKPITQMVSECNISNETKYIYAQAFADCQSLEFVSLPAIIEEIQVDAFRGCTSLQTVSYGGNLETWCNIRLGNSLSNPMSHANHFLINNEEVTTLELPSSKIEISDYQFYGFKNVTTIIFSEGINQIGSRAFANCSSLTSIILPNTITFIGLDAFLDCSLELEIYFAGTKEQWNEIIGADTIDLEIVYFYLETVPPSNGNYWHYEEDVPVKW